METKDIIYELRTKKGLSQEELAEKIFVTRQAVSRWENGETIPNVDALKLLSRLFDVSINTLLGSPRELVCQCCGMPIDDSTISHDRDGLMNEEYCKWCYADGEYTLDIWKRYAEIGGKEKLEVHNRLHNVIWDWLLQWAAVWECLAISATFRVVAWVSSECMQHRSMTYIFCDYIMAKV